MFRRRGVGRTGAAWLITTVAVLLCVAAPASGQAPPSGGQQPPPTRPPLPPGPGATLRPPPTLAPPTPSTTTAAESDPGGGSGSALLPIAVLLAAGAGAAAVVLKIRPRPADTPRPLAPPTGPTGPSPLTHELLEVSRQLTAAASRGDVRRAIVRGALSLVPADAAALVATAPHLAIEAESHPGTLLADGLATGVVARVAETGEHIAQVSATEPAVRHLPASLLALPLVSGGRVDSVLVVVRGAELPFGEADVKVLRALVPMAAAALGAERHAQSAIDQSLRDPLTGAGNRRRFDQDLAAALADPAGGRDLALGIIDLDHFKRVNDTHGHPAGDAASALAAADRALYEAKEGGRNRVVRADP